MFSDFLENFKENNFLKYSETQVGESYTNAWVPVSQNDQGQLITSIPVNFNHLHHIIDSSWSTS